MESFVLVMLLGVCSVHCKMALTCNQEDLSKSYLDEAINMITKARNNCSNYTKNQLRTSPIDCADLFNMGHKKSGVYKIWPMNRLFDEKFVYVYCDMFTDGGGWTVIQRRGDFGTAKDYFQRNWANYKNGFGNIKEDFWLGNDKIYALTHQKRYSVRFDLKDVEQKTTFAVYDKFWIDGEDNKYTLHIDHYTGEAGDSMAHSNNLRFSTVDNGNVDKCAEWDRGGWWYKFDGYKCHDANLNGLYYKGKFNNEFKHGVSWRTWRGFWESLLWTEIKIRPKYFKAIFS